MKEKLYCTLGWDGNPTTCNEKGQILHREYELFCNAKYYPNRPAEKWPIDPDTGEKLEIWNYDKIKKEKRMQEINEYKQHIDMLIGAIFCGFVFICGYAVTAFLRAFGKKGKKWKTK